MVMIESLLCITIQSGIHRNIKRFLLDKNKKSMQCKSSAKNVTLKVHNYGFILPYIKQKCSCQVRLYPHGMSAAQIDDVHPVSVGSACEISNF